ncbi:hypothetical protein PENANT_c072G09162 [Penicillium antarcticum]|uniref:67 kDa myosin-cross-reactive antigen family protein n=1 Tax=Penicillium antarcticum TaxID=416450 RepID=A0A1V6PPK7_9EURO|nr:hypothetical protein PENANT_c072G09162 [Penicillium antarcticum]
MTTHLHRPYREPNHTQAWLIGSGIASLSAAVHLINDAKVPAANIHILDLHSGSGGGMNPSGDAENGYFLPFECHPHFYGSCLEKLLSAVPSQTEANKSILDAIRSSGQFQRPPPQDYALARALKQGESGPEAVDTKGIHIGVKNRMALIRLMLESEKMLGSHTIKDMMDESFFETTFWMLWATSFSLQPWHSAVEFHRHLRKYLEDIQSLNNLKTSNRTEYNLYESLIVPITAYLNNEGIDFRFNTEVTNIRINREEQPHIATEIELLEDGTEHYVRIEPTDVVVITLGATSSGAALGTNNSPPPNLSSGWEDRMLCDWRLWQKLSQVSPNFGDPTNFLSQSLRSAVECFTTTFKGPEFMKLYETLTHDRPGTGALVTLTETNWSITLSIPHQPVFHGQANDVNIVCGYALSPLNEGNYVKKPMSRPQVIPDNTGNIACVGQFVEIMDDTTLNMDYSVRGGQIAVTELMGLPEKPEKLKKSLLLEIFDLII